MSEGMLETRQIQAWVARIKAGEAVARDELLNHVSGRFERLTRKMLRDYPSVRRWAETGDVMQNALLRLLRALPQVETGSTRAFLALAATQIRRELIDLARHFHGPHGIGADHASQGTTSAETPLHDQGDVSHDPAALAEWCEFHEQVELLPDDQREVMDLLFYQGMTQEAAAEVLGVALRTVQRRWQSALLQLHRYLNAEET